MTVPTNTPGTGMVDLVKSLRLAEMVYRDERRDATADLLREAADALSQTIPRTTDEGMREILREERDRFGNDDKGTICFDAALAAMRRVSKTDEGRNAVSDEMVGRALDAFYGPIWRGAPGPRLIQAEMRAALEAALNTGGK